MPNHVTTEVKSDNAVIQSMLNGEGMVDFLEIIPRHKDLELNGANYIRFISFFAAELMCQDKPDCALRVSALAMSDECFEQFVWMMRNKRKHGFYHAIDFSRKAWGTKWNAYGQRAEKHTSTKVTFETAWHHPFPVIEALSRKFPESEIFIRFADEDIGSNCGTYTIKNGYMTAKDIAPSWSQQSDDEKKKWTEFAFKLSRPDADPREYGYNEHWQYDEDVANTYHEAKKQSAQQKTDC